MKSMRMKYLADNLTDAIELARGRIPEMLGSGVAGKAPSIGQLVVTVEQGQPMELLARGRSDILAYWASRDGKFEMAAVGAADTVRDDGKTDAAGAVASIRSRLRASNENVRYFGGLRFDANREIDPEWKPFGRYMFVLPRFEVVRSESGTQFICNLILPDDLHRQTEIIDALGQLPGGNERQTIPLEVSSRADSPDAEGWRSAVESVVKACKANKMNKLVLARRTALNCENDIPARDLINRLKQKASDCYLFLFSPQQGLAFLGATPERLYLRRGRELRCDAIAGTRRRGGNPDEDLKLGLELSQSEKDFSEHRLVVKSIRDALDDMTEDGLIVDGEPERLMKLSRVQHLYTPLRADLKPSVSDELLLTRLHPTAAVGGYPRKMVFKAIREREDFDRGWYAGPVGWIAKDRAEFAVGIRSALIDHSRLYLYAGAGILAESDPEREWDELDSKIEGFLKALEA